MAVSWQQHSGELQLLFDGQPRSPAFVRDGGWVKGQLSPATATLAAGSTRAATGTCCHWYGCVVLSLCRLAGAGASAAMLCRLLQRRGRAGGQHSSAAGVERDPVTGVYTVTAGTH